MIRIRREVKDVVSRHQSEVDEEIAKCNTKFLIIPVRIPSYYPYVFVTFDTETKKIVKINKKLKKHESTKH